MRLTLIAIGQKMPDWVSTGFSEYQKRFAKPWQLNLIEIGTQKRQASTDIATLMTKETAALLTAVPKGDTIIALDKSGKQPTTPALAKQLDNFSSIGQSASLLIGGPEGLDLSVLPKQCQKLSLSHLTFPHPLVRIIIAEQLYRAWSLLHNHPYHR